MTLYDYPPATAFGRIIPKDKIYEHASVSAEVRELFVAQVAQIRWKNKLAPETLNLDATPAVPEIQVFALALKEENINTRLLRCMDEAIPFSIIFELRCEDSLRLAAAPAILSGGKKFMSEYLFSEWMPADTPRTPLPLALNLERLYGIILATLAPFRQRSEESLEAWILRLNAIQEKRKEAAKLERRLWKEKQFNRQIPINRELRLVRQELAALCAE